MDEAQEYISSLILQDSPEIHRKNCETEQIGLCDQWPALNPQTSALFACFNLRVSGSMQITIRRI